MCECVWVDLLSFSRSIHVAIKLYATSAHTCARFNHTSVYETIKTTRLYHNICKIYNTENYKTTLTVPLCIELWDKYTCANIKRTEPCDFIEKLCTTSLDLWQLSYFCLYLSFSRLLFHTKIFILLPIKNFEKVILIWNYPK